MYSLGASQDDQVTSPFDAFEAVHDGIAIFGADERLLFCNQLYRAYLGPLAPLAQPGMDWQRVLDADFAARVDASETAGEEERKRWADRLRSERGQHDYRVAIEGRLFDVAHRPVANGGFLQRRRSVTEPSPAEASDEQYAALLSRILETNPIPVVMARLDDSKVVWRSPAAIDLIGEITHTREHFSEPAERDAYVAELQKTGKVEDFRTRLRSRTGEFISVALSGVLTEFEGETCVVSSITDLTDVLDREALLRKVIEACPAPVLMNRANSGEILYRSPELVALLGDGLDAKAFYADPKDRAGFLAALRQTGEVKEYRERLVNAAGAPFWAAVSGRLSEWKGEEVLVTFTRDLTRQLGMEAELDKQRELAFQTEKMSALGSLLAGVAHELNNPLSVVVGHALMLQEEPIDDGARRQVEKISAAAERCAGIVKTFLSMARQAPARLEPVDLNEVTQVAADVARYGDDAHAVRIETALAGDPPRINGDADQLTQLAVNLIINAEQAIASSGHGDRILLSTSHRSGTAVLSIEDNGPGVPSDVRKRVFEPFFSTKGVGQGTGLGLAMCHQIASSHNGRIRIEDTEGGGARFVVEFPAITGSADHQDDTVPAPQNDRPTGRVLIIDDELGVAELNAEVLDRSGYQATAVATVAEGLTLLGSEPFDVVLSDLNMPHQDGRALYEALLSEYPELVAGVGFITGDTLGRASQAFLAEAGRPYLEKPVSPRELREFVDQLRRKGRT
ncbi:MAG: ATP-binding protein [Pseudomonadota bacterium]